MQKLHKDHILVALVSVLTVLSALVLFNLKDHLQNSALWQMVVFGLSGMVIFALVNMFLLSQKLRERRSLRGSKL